MEGLLTLCLFGVLNPAEANVDIWCDTQLEEVDPLLFGSGDEIDEDFVPFMELAELIDLTGVTVLRMGGIANEYYDWEGNNYNGVRYLDLLDTLIIQQNAETSMDDFLQICEDYQIEPILSVNFQINDPSKAARFVEYCNGDQSSPMGQVRVQRGHPDPYNVIYWEIGNEPDISGLLLQLGSYQWTLYRHFEIPFDQWHWSDSTFATSTQFAQLANTYADSMREASPIPIQIATMSLADNIYWLEETIETCGDNTDWVDLHYYPAGTWEQTPPDTADYIDWLMSIDTGDKAFEPWYQAMCDSVTSFNGGVPLPVCIMEYNAIVVNPDLVWWNYIDGLFVADCIGHLARMGCPMAGCYSIYEGAPDDPRPIFGMIRGDTLSMRATAWVMKLYSDNLTGTMVQAESDAAGSGYGLEVRASLREDDKLCIIAVNKHLTEEFETTITLHGYTSSGYAQLMDITNNAAMEAPANGTTGIEYRGGIWGTPTSFSYTFPRASVTCLLVHPEGSGIELGEPEGIRLHLNPIPAVSEINVQLILKEQSLVELILFDMSGRAVEVVLNDILASGSHSIRLSLEGIPSGTYMLRAVTGREILVRKLVIL